jgi:asparagine synthetase B (glutamine-hydrolysing)
MSEHSSAPVNTYAIGYDGGAAASYYNELSYASEVAKRFGTRHNEILVKPDVAALLPKLMWYLEEPISDSAITTTYLVSELASREVKVILSGVGGDELFAGYKRYLGDHYTRRFLKLAAVVAAPGRAAADLICCQAAATVAGPTSRATRASSSAPASYRGASSTGSSWRSRRGRSSLSSCTMRRPATTASIW